MNAKILILSLSVSFAASLSIPKTPRSTLRDYCANKRGQNPYPEDIHKFVNCHDSNVILQSCYPENLVFNPATGQCDWPYKPEKTYLAPPSKPTLTFATPLNRVRDDGQVEVTCKTDKPWTYCQVGTTEKDNFEASKSCEFWASGSSGTKWTHIRHFWTISNIFGYLQGIPIREQFCKR